MIENVYFNLPIMSIYDVITNILRAMLDKIQILWLIQCRISTISLI